MVIVSGSAVRSFEKNTLMPVSKPLALLSLLLSATPLLAAEQVACHVNYGGETQTIVAMPSSQPYTIPPKAIGSLFLFRVVFEALPSAPAAIKIYSYVDRNEGVALIHQASYAYPAATRSQGQFGFTGQQRVYEPLRDGELQYWCDMQTAREPS